MIKNDYYGSDNTTCVQYRCPEENKNIHAGFEKRLAAAKKENLKFKMFYVSLIHSLIKRQELHFIE